MLKTLLGSFTKWLPIAFVILVFSFAIYAVVQQSLRLSANDPQVELTEEISQKLSEGEIPSAQAETVELSKTLTPFIMIFDKDKKLVYSTSVVNGKSATPPMGVLDAAKRFGENRVTWQPTKGVRLATVTRYFKGSNEGYVLVGRSLREVEKRIAKIGSIVLAAAMSALLGSFVLVASTDVVMKSPFQLMKGKPSTRGRRKK